MSSKRRTMLIGLAAGATAILSGAAFSYYFYSGKKNQKDKDLMCQEVYELVMCDAWATCVKEYLICMNQGNQLSRKELRQRLQNLIWEHCTERWLEAHQIDPDDFKDWLNRNSTKAQIFLDQVTLASNQIYAGHQPTAFDYELVDCLRDMSLAAEMCQKYFCQQALNDCIIQDSKDVWITVIDQMFNEEINNYYGQINKHQKYILVRQTINRHSFDFQWFNHFKNLETKHLAMIQILKEGQFQVATEEFQQVEEIIGMNQMSESQILHLANQGRCQQIYHKTLFDLEYDKMHENIQQKEYEVASSQINDIQNQSEIITGGYSEIYEYQQEVYEEDEEYEASMISDHIYENKKDSSSSSLMWIDDNMSQEEQPTREFTTQRKSMAKSVDGGVNIDFDDEDDNAFIVTGSAIKVFIDDESISPPISELQALDEEEKKIDLEEQQIQPKQQLQTLPKTKRLNMDKDVFLFISTTVSIILMFLAFIAYFVFYRVYS